MTKAIPEITALGDRAIIVRLGDSMDPDTLGEVQAFTRQVSQLALPAITECVPAIATVAIYYDPACATFAEMCAAINAATSVPTKRDEHRLHLVEIPICYDPEFALDLEFVAAHHGLSTDQVIEIHSGGEYLVYMLGFTPGFAYLGGMSQRIATPRRKTPRLSVPAGSVGIAGELTGIYPSATPGGWQIIGRTPLKLFDVARDPPSRLLHGDRVRFVRVCKDELSLSDRCESGR